MRYVVEGQTVVLRNDSGQAVRIITSEIDPPTSEELHIIAGILTARARGSFVAHSSAFFEPGDSKSGFESWVCDDEAGFGER